MFDMEEEHPNMMKHAPAHFSHLPVWINGNAYFEGAKGWKNEKNSFTDNSGKVYVDVCEKDGSYFIVTNIYEVMEGFEVDMISTDTLGKAFEPQQRYENPDGTPITFDCDYLGNHRAIGIIPGPFATKEAAKAELFCKLAIE